MEEPLDIPLFSWVFEANDSLRSPDYHSLRSIKGTEKGINSLPKLNAACSIKLAMMLLYFLKRFRREFFNHCSVMIRPVLRIVKSKLELSF